MSQVPRRIINAIGRQQTDFLIIAGGGPRLSLLIVRLGEGGREGDGDGVLEGGFHFHFDD